MKTVNQEINLWLQCQRLLALIDRISDEAEIAAIGVPKPTNTRPATPTDIQVGHLLWFKSVDDTSVDCNWVVVDEIHNPKDLWKGFTGHDGCRYGYDYMEVEIVEEPTVTEEPKRELIIDVMGSIRSGKSTFTALNYLLLRACNVSVNVIDDDSMQFKPPMDERVLLRNIVKNILSIAKTTEVNLRTTQLRRSGY